MKDEDYKLLSTHESYGGKFNLGVKVYYAGVELTEDEKYELATITENSQIHNKILMMKAKNDPENQKIKIQTIKELTECFTQPVYVEEIPNEYCGSYCCVQYPWLIVTCQEVGRIKIGWRKRVINIDWSQSNIKWTAKDLFVKEDVTKSEFNIHAWGYDKAKEYIKLLQESNKCSLQEMWAKSMVESDPK